MTRYIYGLDPASKVDAFGIIVHELPLDSTLPQLRHIEAIEHQSFDLMYDHLMELFGKYSPYYIVVDYSNERTLSDLIIRYFGSYAKDKVETIVFSTATKLMLKEDGLSAMKQGYRLPRPSGGVHSKAGQLIATLADQLKAEQVIETKSHKVTFDHPPGQHNDLAIAWELSIHGCLRFMRKQELCGVGPHDDELMEKSRATSSLRIVDGDTGEVLNRDHEEMSPSHRAYYKP